MDKKTKFGMIALAVLFLIAGLGSIATVFTKQKPDGISGYSILIALVFIAVFSGFVYWKNKKNKKDKDNE